jgi:hypothetical protein
MFCTALSCHTLEGGHMASQCVTYVTHLGNA